MAKHRCVPLPPAPPPDPHEHDVQNYADYIDPAIITHRTLFTFWNSRPMPLFEARCLENMQRFNPTWRILPLSMTSAPRILGRHMLPRGWEEMAPPLQSDCVRLAALRKLY